MQGISVLEAAKLPQARDENSLIIDVRTAMEHAEKHLAAEHIHAPLDALDPVKIMAGHAHDKEAPVYLLCRSGKRAEAAAHKFTEAGYKNVHVIGGGLIACEECGLDIESSAVKAPMSLERQVRIAAGGIAATGGLLALLVNPLYSVIPLLVGSGLVFAGITDQCGMALLLAKAPWNKVRI